MLIKKLRTEEKTRNLKKVFFDTVNLTHLVFIYLFNWTLRLLAYSFAIGAYL